MTPLLSQPLPELDSWQSKALLKYWNIQNLDTLGSRLGVCKVGLSVSPVLGCFRVTIWTSQSKDPRLGKGTEAPAVVQNWGWESNWPGKAHTGLCLGGVMGLPTLLGAGGLRARSYLAGANAALPSTHVEVIDVPMQPLATVADLVIHDVDLGLLQDIST